MSHAIENRIVEHQTSNLTNSWPAMFDSHLYFSLKYFFEVNPRHIILLLNILVYSAEKLGLLKKNVSLYYYYTKINSNSLMSSYIHMVCLNWNAYSLPIAIG